MARQKICKAISRIRFKHMSMFIRAFDNFTIKGYIARKAFMHIRDSYDKMLPTGMRATVTSHIAPDPTCNIQNGAFGLRYQQMVAAKEPNSPFPPDHYCVHGTQFHDPCDFYPSTFHINIWKRDRVIASSRYVDGNDEELEMESFGWYDLRKNHKELGDNFVEPTRVVGDKSIRGSAVVPLMYLRSMIEFIERDYDHVIGLVSSSNQKVLKHYENWLGCEVITKSDFPTDEFIPGNRCVVFKQRISGNEEKIRNQYILTNVVPTYLACRAMMIRDRFTGKID